MLRGALRGVVLGVPRVFAAQWAGSRGYSTTTTKTPVPMRFVTATSLFDGHDASINIMRRLLQECGAEVVHLAHNRSVDEVIHAALQEDVQGVAISSYQGGHIEYFQYLVDLLRKHGR
eukprot:RCo019539